VKSLKSKYAKALPARQESLEVFQELDKSVDKKTRKEWERQEGMAMKFRGDYLKVYNVKSEMGECFIQHIFSDHNSCFVVVSSRKDFSCFGHSIFFKRRK
jgi:hypothetical protein